MSDTQPLLLAFLGAGNYGQAYYVLNGKRSPQKTRLSFHALAGHLDISFEQIRIFGTEPNFQENLKGSSWNLIQETFGRKLGKDQKIVVPFGLNREEHYAFFSRLIEVTEDAEELVVDMTHGFRSFPVILLMSLFFTEAIHKNPFKQLRIYYAAYEAGRDTEETYFNSKDEQKAVKKVDFVEMDIVPELLHWTKAAERFIKFGLASDLASLTGIREFAPMNKRFDVLHKHIAYNAVHDIPAKVEQVQEEFHRKKKKLKHVHPLFYLQDSVSEVFVSLTAGFPSERQLRSAKYFFRIERFGQAAVAFKEYLISLLTEAYMGKDREEEAATQEPRKWPEKVLGLLDQYDAKEEIWRTKSEKLKSKMSDWDIPVTNNLQRTVRVLNEIRNTFAHGKHTNRIDELHSRLSEMIEQAQQWNTLKRAPVNEWITFIKPFYENGA